MSDLFAAPPAAPSPTALHVLHVQVDNILRVVSADVTLGEGVVVVSGDNAQGKSSFLNAIEMALLGKRAESEVPIHEGHATGRVEIILGRDGKPRFTIERSFKRGSPSKLIVRCADGTAPASPQKMLDELLGLRTWDPMEFAEPPGEKTDEGRRKKQVEMLLRACPLSIDLDKWAKDRTAAYDARTDANRDVKRVRSAIDAMPVAVEPGADEDVSGMQARYRSAAETNARIAEAKRSVDSIYVAIVNCDEDIAELEARIASLRSKRALYADQLAGATAAAQAEPVNVDAVAAELSAAQSRNAERAVARERKAQRDGTLAKLREYEKVSSAWDDEIARLDAAREKALAAAKFPVPGLSVDEAGILFKGRPFSQASTAETIEVSLAIGAALSGDLKTMFVRDGNDLGKAALERISAWAKSNGHQLIIERVAEDVPGAFVFEDGRVVGRVGDAS